MKLLLTIANLTFVLIGTANDTFAYDLDLKDGDTRNIATKAQSDHSCVKMTSELFFHVQKGSVTIREINSIKKSLTVTSADASNSSAPFVKYVIFKEMPKDSISSLFKKLRAKEKSRKTASASKAATIDEQDLYCSTDKDATNLSPGFEIASFCHKKVPGGVISFHVMAKEINSKKVILNTAQTSINNVACNSLVYPQ